jgi:uncharacterized membrane protein
MELKKEEILRMNDPTIEKVKKKYGDKIGDYYKYSNILARLFIIALIVGLLLFVLNLTFSLLINVFIFIPGMVDYFPVLMIISMILTTITMVLILLPSLIGLIYCLLTAHLTHKMDETNWTIVFLLGGILCVVISLLCPLILGAVFVMDFFYKKQIEENL